MLQYGYLKQQIYNWVGNKIEVIGCDIKTINLGNSSYAISREGVVIQLRTLADIKGLLNEYYNTEIVVIDVTDGIKKLNEIGMVVYKGKNFNNIDNIPNYLMSLPQNFSISNEQKLITSLLMLDNLVVSTKDDKTLFSKKVSLVFGSIEDNNYIYGKGYSNSLEDAKRYNDILAVNSDEPLDISMSLMQYLLERFNRSIALESKRSFNIISEELSKKIDIEEIFDYFNKLRINQRKIQYKIDRYIEWKKYLEFVLNRQSTFEMFLAYKYRKENKFLYDDTLKIPTNLIKQYYRYYLKDSNFEEIKKSFITHYCNNESKLEGIEVNQDHGPEEIEGLKLMYEFMHDGGIDELIVTDPNLPMWSAQRMIDIDYKSVMMLDGSFRDAIFATTGLELSLLTLHEILYSKTPNPESGKYFRHDQRYLPGSGLDIPNWDEIGNRLKTLDIKVQELLKKAKEIREGQDSEAIINYIDECVILKHNLLVVHPFIDGNGRVIRAFINKLLENAGLPPVYIKYSEKRTYGEALKKANDGDYRELSGFYKYKICDSIVELYMNPQILTEKRRVSYQTVGGVITSSVKRLVKNNNEQ